MKDGTHCGRRTAWLGGLAAALSAAVMPLAQSKNIIDEWSRVQAPRRRH
ncbi:MAG TPA: hypothetical protein VGN43_05440 [Steroidobacteraceae bacterium]|jgi:hypothetical protein|nr:hypothetical protein [Steroidobacteraceae bacterium]